MYSRVYVRGDEESVLVIVNFRELEEKILRRCIQDYLEGNASISGTDTSIRDVRNGTDNESSMRPIN